MRARENASCAKEGKDIAAGRTSRSCTARKATIGRQAARSASPSRRGERPGGGRWRGYGAWRSRDEETAGSVEHGAGCCRVNAAFRLRLSLGGAAATALPALNRGDAVADPVA